MTGGMAAIISAYLLALATKFVSLEGAALCAAYLGTVSVVLLVLFKLMSFYEKEGDMNEKNPMGILFSLGLTSGLLTYVLILASIKPILAIIAIATFCLALFPFIWAFKSGS
ncbi:MAG: hypothetical protein CVU58_00725 [Deltaproteobacteria bacterium HGW-Deltaproteobacteria-16]|nr:MAG: hypothetical protein CVU58_00725 [Deltaproteobacteria bacterium HGW-Deltaproteobacteria-16]